MKVDIPGAFVDAWALFRRHQQVLVALAGVFIFLPTLWLLLYVPAAPPLPDQSAPDAQVQLQVKVFAEWVTANSGAFLIAALMPLYGSLSICMFFLDRGSEDVRAAMIRAIGQLPRLALASFLISIPASIGLLALALPGLYALGRTMLVVPVLAAERRQTALAAIWRSLMLTRGNGLVLAALAGLGFVAGQILPSPFTSLADAMSASHAANPVMMMILNSLASLAATIVALATVLLRVAIYRRVGSISGI